MINVIKQYLAKREGQKKYKEALFGSLMDNKLDERDKGVLEEIVERYNLRKDDLLSAQRQGFGFIFSQVVSNQRITEEEKKDLEALLNYFDANPDELGFDQQAFNKYYTLGLLEQGILKEVAVEGKSFPIVMQNDEVLHWLCPASLMKYKNITERYNYGGFTHSVKIIGGLRYRSGSIKVSKETREYLDTEDNGTLWLTNQRVGFKGHKRNFEFPYKKIVSFELTEDGLKISKEGKEFSYILRLEDYDVPCSIISLIVNKSGT